MPRGAGFSGIHLQYGKCLVTAASRGWKNRLLYFALLFLYCTEVFGYDTGDGVELNGCGVYEYGSVIIRGG